MRPFEDHFSQGSSLYARARPAYPEALVSWLASLVEEHHLAWDAATGSGQLARMLVHHFPKVHASDASSAQLSQAQSRPGVEFVLERAETPSLKDGSVGLVTVGAAAHWLDLPAFYAAVERVAAPRALLALFSYGTRLRGCHHLQEAIQGYADSIEPYWTESYRVVAERYAGLPFPYERIEMPEFSAQSIGDLVQLMDLMRTWSGSMRAFEVTGVDPVAAFEDQLRWAWTQEGPVEASRTLYWPIFGHVGRVN